MRTVTLKEVRKEDLLNAREYILYLPDTKEWFMGTFSILPKLWLCEDREFEVGELNEIVFEKPVVE